MAVAPYIEPIRTDMLSASSRPRSPAPAADHGGRRLNGAMVLWRAASCKKQHRQMIGANAAVIAKAEVAAVPRGEDASAESP